MHAQFSFHQNGAVKKPSAVFFSLISRFDVVDKEEEERANPLQTN
jgi:hypothetical protein